MPPSRPSIPTPSLTNYLSALPTTFSTFLSTLSTPLPANTPQIPTPLRRASPFHPPPLPPLSLSAPGSSPHSLLLTSPLAEEIRLLLPPRLQLADTWRLRYGLDRDGVSLATLYKNVGEIGGVGGWVLVIRDGGGGTFGAYLSHAPQPAAHYFGTGECFLWRSTTLPSLPPPPSADTTRMGRSTTISSVGSNPSSPVSPSALNGDARFDSRHGHSRTSSRQYQQQQQQQLQQGTMRFKAFPYSGLNEYLILCEAGFLSVGGGEGRYGLWLDDVLERGVSEACATFGNEGLSDEGGKFDVLGVEVWSVGG